jgi:ribosomal protein S18 acetylase RimI-like enzyme
MPAPAIDVRPIREADLAAVTALLVAQLREHRVTTPDAKIASAVETVFRHPERGRILVALEDGRPVGVAALSFIWPIEHGDKSAWLEELYVDPAARNRGIGTRLLREALRTAAECGAVAVDLEVDADHARVAELYAREGFQRLPRARWVRPLA